MIIAQVRKNTTSPASERANADCHPVSSRLNKSGVVARLWPNGEIAFHLPKKHKMAALVKGNGIDTNNIWRWWVTVYGIAPAISRAFLLGLSSVTNFDRVEKRPPRYGLKGISSLGRRRVRNAAYMLTRSVGKRRLTFSTVTLPALHCEDLAVIHERWHKVIDRYRLLMSRQLRASGLTGELVGVTEIQEKRYETNGFPVLHAHFVFVGRSRSDFWAITTRRHDYLWRKAVNSVLCGPLPKFDSACQLKSVKKDAAGYLGKYMSKGAASIKAVVDEGFEWALPKQWWSCSRSLVQRMEKNMRHFSEGVPWLIARASDPSDCLFDYYSIVKITMPDGVEVDVGSYGRLNKEANGKVRQFLGL